MAQAATSIALHAQPRFHYLFWDLGLTGITQLATLLGNLLVVSLFGRLLGVIGLAEYLLLRRVMSWMQTGFSLGLGIALPRYVAHAMQKHKAECANYFVAACTCLGVMTFTLGMLMNLSPQNASRLLFGSGQQMSHLIFPLWVLIAGFTAHGAVYGYYRGCLRMKLANALQCCNYGLIPIAAVAALANTHSVAFIVNVTGGSMAFCACLFAIPVLRQLAAHKWLSPYHRIVELLRYGIPRVPGEFGGGALFASGPVIAAHYMPVTQVSSLLLGLSLLVGVGVTVAPIGLILLSKVSMMLAQNRMADVQHRLGYLLSAILELSVFACLQLMVFSDVLMRVWVGPGFLGHITVIRIVLLAVPFYLYYAALRSFIDAASVKPYNTGNVLVSLAVFLALVGLTIKLAPAKFLLESFAAALVVAIVVLGWLTARTVQRIYDVGLAWRSSVLPLIFGLLLGIGCFVLRWSTGFQMNAVASFSTELATSATFLALLVLLRSRWLLFFWNTAFPRGKFASMSLPNS
jgi:O-antigen/teichoic acid export membrane protein